MSFGTQVLFENINLNIPKNEKVGVVVVNGAGKSTLLKLIMGLLEPDSGYIKLGNKTDIGYYAQE